MLFERDEDLELQPKRTKTLLISIGIHLALVVFFLFNPDLLTAPPKRIIKVMGQDYDLSKQELTELVPPPDALRPKPAVPDKPLVQPPAPKQPEPQQQAQIQPPPQQAPPPPPPPPPPPQPQTPPPVIGPDDVLKEGARPDGQAKASRGNTTEQARAGSQEQQPPPKPEPKPQQAQSEKQLPPIALNTNPNAMRLPGGNIMDSANRAIQQQIEDDRKRTSSVQGPRTGTPAGQENPDFATEEPKILSDTKGYDFGPYMNQVVNRVRVNWYTLIPEIARLGKRGKVVIIFTITKNGTIANLRLAANSGADPLDKAAYGAITASNPFAQLPANFDGDHLDLQFTFLYNIR